MSHFDRFRNDGFKKLAATKVFHRLRDLRQEGTEADARRWPWELLQNAKDAAGDGPVRAAYAWADSAGEAHVRFRHSGRPFTDQDLFYLVHQITTKDAPVGDERPETTRRYGTGFLTTHLLSERVGIRGHLVPEGQPPVAFDVLLDRAGKTPDEIAAGMEATTAALDLAVAERRPAADEPDGLNTAFHYAVTTEDGRAAARVGLDDLERELPLVLAFNARIGEVALEPAGVTYRVADDERTPEGLRLVGVEAVRRDGTRAAYRQFALAEGERATVAVEFALGGDGTPNLVPLPAETPRLFCDFPLTGTEAFPLPAAVNSPLFFPSKERDGVPLTDRADAEVAANKAVLAEAVQLYEPLVDALVARGARDLFALARVGAPPAALNGWLSPEWFKAAVQQPLRAKLLTAPLVETAAGERKPLRLDGEVAVWLPSHPTAEGREALWAFGEAWLRTKLPRKEHVHAWYEAAWDDCPPLTTDVLVNSVADTGSLDELGKKLGLSEAEALPWLVRLLGFLEEVKHPRLFGRRMTSSQVWNGKAYATVRKEESVPLLPNQHGRFCLPGTLFLDVELDDMLKDAAEDLGTDYRATLLHRDVPLRKEQVAGQKTAKDLAISIEEAVKERIKGARSEATRRAFQALLVWIADHDARAQELFGLWLYENQTALFPPREALDLIRRVPELERENEALRDAQAQLKATQAELHEANEQLQREVEGLRQQLAAAPSPSAPTTSQDETLQQAKHYAETWMEIKRALGALGTAEAAITAKDLQHLLETRPELFASVSKESQEAYLRFRTMLERAKARVRAALDANPLYDTSGWTEVPTLPTIIEGVKRRGVRAESWHPPHPITLVIRPADGGFVIFYDAEERSVLATPDAELWIEGDGGLPERLTLGGLVLRLGVNRLPLSIPVGSPSVLQLN